MQGTFPREWEVPGTLFYSLKLPAQEVVLSKSTGTVRVGLAVLNTSEWSSTHSILFQLPFVKI